MSGFPLKPAERDCCPLPDSPRQLGAETPVVFHTMTVAECLVTLARDGVRCTEDAVSDPAFQLLGYPGPVRARLRVALPEPYLGTLGDCVPTTFSPLTLAAYGAVRGSPGVAGRPASDLVALVIPLAGLSARRIPFIAVDRSPALPNAVFADEPDLRSLPWARFHERDVATTTGTQDERERAGAEVLVWRRLPLVCVAEIACADGAAAERLRAEAARRNRQVPTVHKSQWFFPDRQQPRTRC